MEKAKQFLIFSAVSVLSIFVQEAAGAIQITLDNGISPIATVTDCTIAPCLGPDIDPRPGIISISQLTPIIDPITGYQISGTLRRGGGGALVDAGVNRILNFTNVDISRVQATPNNQLKINFIENLQQPVFSLTAADGIQGTYFAGVPFAASNLEYQGFVNGIPIGPIFKENFGPLMPGATPFKQNPPHVIPTGFFVNQLRGELTLNLTNLGDRVVLPNSAEVGISVPEPTSTLSLLALGTLGAASTLKRKQKQ